MMKTERFLLTASVCLAITFILSCSGDDGSDGQNGINGESGQDGTSCVSEDGGAYFVIKCGEQQSKLPKAMCGATAYDPEAQFCDSRNIQLYTPVKIGEQVWMKENLNYNASGSKCYGNDPGNCAKYGRLYDWETANDACPTGWHLPSDAEWTALETAVGGNITAGKKLKATSGWDNNKEDLSGNGTDDYGFSAKPGGQGNSAGQFAYEGSDAFWWSASKSDSEDNTYKNYEVYSDSDAARWRNFTNLILISVRCLKD